MDNRELACLLAETADLMELGQENPFKVRAYTTGARIVESLSEEEIDERVKARLAAA